MNLQIFSPIGYVSVLLWLAMLALWVAHALRRPRRWWCHWALVAGLLALMCAKINSVTYVNRIQIDQSEAIATAQAKREAARKAAEEARAEDVAQIRFAEDDADDYLDKAGMDEAEKKYLENAGNTVNVPAWKQQKKERSEEQTPDDSLESMLNPEEGNKAADALTEMAEKEAAAEPVIMSAEDHQAANRLDALNLKWIKLLILLGIIYLIMDYLKRLNHYNEAYLPLPVPSRWVNALNPAPPIWSRPDPPRREMAGELAWITRRGDAFIYLTTDENKAGQLPKKAGRLPGDLFAVDILHVDKEIHPVDDDFVFEGLWYNRASCVIASASRAESFLKNLLRRLRDRRETRACVRQTVHLVWDMEPPLPENLRFELIKLAAATGWSVMEEKSTAIEGNR